MALRSKLVVGAVVFGLTSIALGVPIDANEGLVEVVDRQDAKCPDHATCASMYVRCPGIPVRRAHVAFHEVEEPQGMVVLHTGGGGANYWSQTRSGSAAIDALHAANLSTAEIRWLDHWARARNEAGPLNLSCAPAALMGWVYETAYVPLNLATNGTCGFCFAGSSQGAAAGAYFLSAYGGDAVFDRMVLVSGPPYSYLAGGCLPSVGDADLTYRPRHASGIDRMYGYASRGPCRSDDSTWVDRWDGDDLVGNTTFSTPIDFVIGLNDTTASVWHARLFAEVLAGNGTTVQVHEIEGMTHKVAGSPDGMRRVVEILTR